VASADLASHGYGIGNETFYPEKRHTYLLPLTPSEQHCKLDLFVSIIEPNQEPELLAYPRFVNPHGFLFYFSGKGRS